MLKIPYSPTTSGLILLKLCNKKATYQRSSFYLKMFPL
nr:MAG TPA: hypothetical protein [Bacteriophage sp.]